MQNIHVTQSGHFYTAKGTFHREKGTFHTSKRNILYVKVDIETSFKYTTTIGNQAIISTKQ